MRRRHPDDAHDRLRRAARFRAGGLQACREGRRGSLQAPGAALFELGPRAELDRQLRAAVVRAREYLRREAPRLSMLMEGESRDQRTARLVETFDEFLRRLASWQTADQGDDALDEAETDADA